MNYEKVYTNCFRIRAFEKRVEKEFTEGKMRGTTHGCVGQEIIPVFAMEFVDRDNDYITGTHRCHGQVLAYTEDAYRLACEMMGRKDGFVCGRGGSQHIKVDNYITNGITGGMVSIGTGIAMAIKKEQKKGIVVSFLGDGGFNEGYVQESFNLASANSVPILYICENNKYAMSTQTNEYSAGSFEERIKALGIRYEALDTAEPDVMYDVMKNAFVYVNEKKKPCFLDVHTARLCGHSKSDSMEYKRKEEIEYEKTHDPLIWLEKKLGTEKVEDIRKDINNEIDKAFLRAVECEEIDEEVWLNAI